MTRLELAKKRAKELEKTQSNVTNKENTQSTSNTSKSTERLELAKQRANELESAYKKAQEKQQAWNEYVKKNGVDKINSDCSKYMQSVTSKIAPKLSQTDSVQDILSKKNVITPSEMQDASEALEAYKAKKSIKEDKTSNEDNEKRTVEYDDSLTKFQENDFKIFQKTRKTAQDKGWTNTKNPFKTAVASYTGLEKEKKEGTLFKMPENLKDNLRYFEDGYQFGDLTKSSFETQKELTKDLLSTGVEGAIDIGKGTLSVSENLANAGASAIAFGADLIGQDDFANALRKQVAKGSPFTSLDNVINNATEWYNKNSFTGDLLDSANEGIGQTFGQLAVGEALLGAGNVPIKFGKHILNIPTTAFLTGLGSSASETYAEAEQQLNGIENATWREKAQMALRTIRGGIIEGVTEGMFGMLGVGGSDITDEWAKKAMAQATSSYEKQLIKVLYSGGGEAVEEFVSYSANWLFDNGFINKLGNLDLTQDYNWDEVFEEMASAFISSGISQGGTSITQINQAIKNAISEAEQMIGRELTTEEKTEIKNNITDIVLEAKEELEETVKMYPAKQSEIDYANIEKTVNKNNEYLRNKYGVKINEENVLFQKPELSKLERLKQKFQIKHDNYDKPIVQSKSNNVQKTNKNVQKQTKNVQKQAKNVQDISDNVQNASDNTSNNAQNTSDNTQTLTNTAKSFQDIIKSNSSIQGLEDYSEQDVKNIVSDHVEDLYSEAKIKNIKINEKQDTNQALNVTIEYDGNISQEELNNILNQDPLVVDGVKININAEDLNVFEENKGYNSNNVYSDSFAKNDFIEQEFNNQKTVLSDFTKREIIETVVDDIENYVQNKGKITNAELDKYIEHLDDNASPNAELERYYREDVETEDFNAWKEAKKIYKNTIKSALKELGYEYDNKENAFVKHYKLPKTEDEVWTNAEARMSSEIKKDMKNFVDYNFQNYERVDKGYVEDYVDRLIKEIYTPAELEYIYDKDFGNEVFFAVNETLYNFIEEKGYVYKSNDRGGDEHYEPDMSFLENSDEIRMVYDRLPSTDFEFAQLDKIRDEIQSLVWNVENTLPSNIDITYDESGASADATYITLYNKDTDETYEIRVGNHFKWGTSGEADEHIRISDFSTIAELKKAVKEAIENGLIDLGVENVDIMKESDYNGYTTNQKANKISNKISNNEKAQVASEALQWRQNEADGIHYIDLSAKGYKSYVYNKTGNDIQTLLRIDGTEDFKNYIRKGVEDGDFASSEGLIKPIEAIRTEYGRYSNDNDVLSNGRNSKANDRTHIKSIRQQRRNNNGKITTKSSRNELTENSEQSSFSLSENQDVEETNKQYDNQITIEDSLRTNMYYKSNGNKPVVVAQRYWNGFEKKGYIDLNGKTVRDAQDVAELSQIFRNPQYETARMIYVKGDTIVGQEAVSSHLPNSSAISTEQNRSKAFYKIEDRMKRLNADGYYMVHNHPSGVAKASQQDINLTKTVSSNVKGFKGHIIVDHGTYAYISKGIDGNITYRNELKVDDKNALYKGSTFETALPTDKVPWSEKINSREDFASLMYNLKNSPNYSSLILSDTDNKINAIIDIPNGFFNMRANHVEGYIKNVAKQYGAVKAFVGTSDSNVFEKLKGISNLQDAILYKNNKQQFAEATDSNLIFNPSKQAVAVRTAEETKDERIERVRKYIEEFQQGMGTLGVKVDRKEIVNRIIENYGVTTKGNSKELDKVSTEIQKLFEDGALTDKKIEGYAEYLIDNLKVTVDDFYSANKELKELIRQTKLYASDTVKNGFGSWNDFRKNNMGILRLTNDENALPIDTFYKELTEVYGEKFFPSDIANISDQLERISEVAKQIKEIEQTLRENIQENFGEDAIKEIQNGLTQNLKTWRDKMAQENSENTDENSKPDKIKKRSYTETLRGNEMVDKFLNIEDMDYAVMRNQKALNEANNILDTKGYEKALNYFESVIESHKIASASDVVLGERLIQETIKKR